jgi:hypothetical protein
MIKVERNENLYECKKKKKKKLYQHNFFLSSWPSNMGCWVLGIRVFEGSCAAQILWRFLRLAREDI